MAEQKHGRSVGGCAVISVLLAGAAVTIIWLIYRPYTPMFAVVDAAVYGLNITSPPAVNAFMAFTIVARNDNERLSVYYDGLLAYVMHGNQAITKPAAAAALFQERESNVAMSPLMGGEAVPVSAMAARSLEEELSRGAVKLTVVVQGRIRWRYATIKTPSFGVYVRCHVLVGLTKGRLGQLPLLTNSLCNVDIG